MCCFLIYGEFVRKNLLVPRVSTEDCVLHVLIFICTTSHKKGVERKMYAKVVAVYFMCTILLAQYFCVFCVTICLKRTQPESKHFALKGY